MNRHCQTQLRVTGDLHLAEEWELVLLAQGLAASLSRTAEGVVISVPEAEAERALASLAAYDRENRGKIVERVEPMALESWVGGAAMGLLLLLFYSITVQWLPRLPWYPRGAADAGRIMQGEIWRTVTALTLHGDFAHVLSNAVAATIFLSFVSSQLGLGFAGMLVLLAGAAGNLANAALHGPPHSSVGASTAVFAAVGLLAALSVTGRRRGVGSRWRRWQPVAAALALFGMLGSSGQRVDVGAHLLGLLAGAVLGLIIGWMVSSRLRLPVQWACGGAAIATIVVCWTVALR